MSSLVLPNDSFDNIQMVIFDKDGTLIDIHHYWCSMIEFRAEFFIKSLKDKIINTDALYVDLIKSMGINPQTKKMKPEGPVGIKSRNFIMNIALDTIKKYNETYTLEMVENIFKEVDKYSIQKINNIVIPLPHVKNILNDLDKSNIKMAIATTDLTKRAVLAMKSLGFDKYFVDIVGADLVKNVKPSADLVNYIIEKNNISKNNTIVIGDSIVDLVMSKNAGCRFIGIKTGLYTEDLIKEGQNIIENFRQLKVLR